MVALSQVEIIAGFDCYDWRNALTILKNAHPQEWNDIYSVLSGFK